MSISAVTYIRQHVHARNSETNSDFTRTVSASDPRQQKCATPLTSTSLPSIVARVQMFKSCFQSLQVDLNQIRAGSPPCNVASACACACVGLRSSLRVSVAESGTHRPLPVLDRTLQLGTRRTLNNLVRLPQRQRNTLFLELCRSALCAWLPSHHSLYLSHRTIRCILRR